MDDDGVYISPVFALLSFTSFQNTLPYVWWMAWFFHTITIYPKSRRDSFWQMRSSVDVWRHSCSFNVKWHKTAGIAPHITRSVYVIETVSTQLRRDRYNAEEPCQLPHMEAYCEIWQLTPGWSTNLKVLSCVG